MLRNLVSAVVAQMAFVASAAGQPAVITFSDELVRKIIVEECRALHHQKRPCACPHDATFCPGISAYEKSGAAQPFCKPDDVKATHIAAYRAGDKSFIQRRCRAK